MSTRAAIYARVSTAEQIGGTSLGEQVEVCQAEADRHGWTVAQEHVYVDAGISGKDATRPAWGAMLDAARRGDIDAVVVRKLDRFSRNAGHAITETDRLQNLGVRLVVVDQGIDMGTAHGKLLRTMLAGVAEMEADLITSRSVAGQRAKARSGQLPGGEPPYGWKRQRLDPMDPKTSRVVPDEDERATLRLGYELLVTRRLTAYQTAKHLNDAGVKPRKVEHWSAEVVRGIWRNPALATGQVVWGLPKNSQDGGQRKHKAKTNRDGTPKYGDPVTIDLGDPPLTMQQHRALVRALARRADWATPAAPKSRMLSGRVFTTAGHSMYSVNLPREPWEGAYRCSQRKARYAEAQTRCSCPQLRALPIEQLVWAEVVQLLGDPDRLQAAARAYLQLPEDGTDRASDARALEGVRGEVTKLERALDRAERGVLLADSLEDERRHQRLVSDLRAELQAARERLAGYEALLASDQARGEALQDVAALAERARGRLETLSAADRAEVVRILQVSVVLGGDIVAGMPETVAISGVIDPRLWDSGSGNQRSRPAPTPGDWPADPPPDPQSPSRGGTMAAVAFAGLLVVIMRSDEVRGILTDLIRRALSVP